MTFLYGQELCCKPCKIITHFYYPQMFVSGTPSVFFFADVLVGILGLLDFGVDLHVPLLLSLLLDLVVDSLLLLVIGVLGIGLLVLVLWGLLVLGLTPETETTTNLSIVSLVSKEAQISLSNDVVM